MEPAFEFRIADDFDGFTSSFQKHGETPNAILTVRVQHYVFERGSYGSPQISALPFVLGLASQCFSKTLVGFQCWSLSFDPHRFGINLALESPAPRPLYVQNIRAIELENLALAGRHRDVRSVCNVWSQH